MPRRPPECGDAAGFWDIIAPSPPEDPSNELQPGLGNDLTAQSGASLRDSEATSRRGLRPSLAPRAATAHTPTAPSRPITYAWATVARINSMLE